MITFFTGNKKVIHVKQPTEAPISSRPSPFLNKQPIKIAFNKATDQPPIMKKRKILEENSAIIQDNGSASTAIQNNSSPSSKDNIFENCTFNNCVFNMSLPNNNKENQS